VATVNGSINSPGSQTITATCNSPSIQGTSDPIQVTAQATKLVVQAPTGAAFGSQFNFTVTAEDDYNNVATGFSDNVDFSSNDPNAILPNNQMPLANGTGTFSAQLFCPGNRTITVSDDNNEGVDSGSASIAVSAFPLIVNSTGGQLDDNIQSSALTLPDAVELANFQTAYSNITFDPTVFPAGTSTEISLGGTLDSGTLSIYQTNVKVTISG
jgi:hypothetical protein